MKVIITGGSGLIGQELTSSLCSDKHEVIILSRNPERVQNLPSKARAEKWDGKTAQGWGHLVNEADAIVNLAGESIAGGESVPEVLLKGRWTAARKQGILESRLNAGKAVTEAIQAASHKPSVVVQCSAVGFYGNQGNNELTETTPGGTDFLAEVCKKWEASTAEVEASGVRRVIIRTGVVLSTLGGVLPLVSFPYKLFSGGPLGSGKQWFPWIHMEDQVGAIRFLLEKSHTSGVYNLSAPQPLTNNDFGKVMGKVMGRPHWLPAPTFALKLALGEIADALLLTSQRQIPKRLTSQGYAFKFADAGTALKDLLR